MTFSTAFVNQKLELLRGYTAELKALLDNTPDAEFLAVRSGPLHIAERLVQVLVDAMIDINQHFIRELNFPLSEDLRGTFAMMGEHGVLPPDFAEKITPITGVRNILVHQYDKLDKEMFLRNLRHNFSDFEQYQRYVMEYLGKDKSGD